MGLFDFFNKGPSKGAIAAQVQKATERYAQSDYRRMAMDKLLKWQTKESLRGILERFCVVVQSPHWDEEEKRWLVEELVKIGEQVRPILRDFILEKNEINQALSAYRKIIANDALYTDLLIEALKCRPPSDHRSVQSKQEIIAALAELELPGLENLLKPYLHDHSDDVQSVVIDALAHNMSENTKNEFINLLGSEAHSARVLRKAASYLAKEKVSFAKDVLLAEAVKDDFEVVEGKLVRLQHRAE